MNKAVTVVVITFFLFVNYAFAQDEAPEVKRKRIIELRQIVLSKESENGAKYTAFYDIFRIGGKEAEETFIDIYGKVGLQEKEVILGYLAQSGSESALLFVISAIEDKTLMKEGIRALGPNNIRFNKVILDKLLKAIEKNIEVLRPEDIASVLIIFSDNNFQPAAKLIRSLMVSPNENIRSYAYRNIGGVGDYEDVPVLWKAIKSDDAGLRRFALESLGKLGRENDAQDLLAMAQLREKAGPKSDEYDEIDDILHARSEILLRAIKFKASPLKIQKTEMVAGGCEIKLKLPEKCEGVIVAIQNEKISTMGFVRGDVIKVALPDGKFKISIAALVPQDVESSKLDIWKKSYIIEPAGLLQTLEPIVLENIQSEKPAGNLSITNAVEPQGVDEYCDAMVKAGLPDKVSGVVILCGAGGRIPSGEPHLENPLKSVGYMRHWATIVGAKSFVALEPLGKTMLINQYNPKNRKFVVVGQLCKVWYSGPRYVFISLGYYTYQDAE